MGEEAAGSVITVFMPLWCPTVDLSSRLAHEITGLDAASASTALSACAAGGASACGSLAATGFGTTLFVASSGCEKLAGTISPGVTTTLAPILVQFHIFTAKAMGMRMQPCEAG